MSKLTYLVVLLVLGIALCADPELRKRKGGGKKLDHIKTGNVNPCFKFACRKGEHCQVGPVYCLKSPCPQPRPICVPNNRIIRAKDPCEDMECTKCKMCAVIDGNAQCIPVSPRKNRPENPYDPCP